MLSDDDTDKFYTKVIAGDETIDNILNEITLYLTF
jgi:hypothetical protein